MIATLQVQLPHGKAAHQKQYDCEGSYVSHKFQLVAGLCERTLDRFSLIADARLIKQNPSAKQV